MKRTALFLMLPLLLAADAREVAARDGANLQRPTWSNDGQKLGYEANFHDRKVIELYVGDPAARSFRRVTPSVRGASSLTAGFSTVESAQVAHELAWSPASIGRYVYSASNDMQDYDLYLGGGGPLTQAPGADGGAAWSPDGRFIAFTSGRTGEGDLYLLDMEDLAAPPRQVTSQPGSSELYVAWSPDSTKLAFVGHSKSGDNLWLMPNLDAEPVQLTTWSGSQTRPSFSPQGDKIAFYGNLEDPARFDLYMVDARPAAVPRLVTRGVVPNASGPSWTPDGQHLVVVLEDDQRFDPIALVRGQPDSQPRILELGTVGHGDLDVTVGPAGRIRVAYVAQGLAGDEVRDFKRLFVGEVPIEVASKP